MRLKTLSCPKCAAAVPLSEGEPATICKACGTVVTADAASDKRRARRFPNVTPIQLGLKGQFHGREYEVIGRMVLSMVEEGERYTWDEWQLLAPDGDVLYLEFDEGRWKISAPFVPEKPIGPAEASVQGIGARVDLDGHSAQVQQVSRATVEYVEGELTYAARVGDSYRYLDAASGSRFYSVEWTDDEISFYRGEHVSVRQVLVMFGLYAELAAYDARAKRGDSQRVFAVVCLVASFFAFLGWTASFSPGRLVGQGTAMIHQVPDDGLRFGPFSLTPGRGVHRLRVEANLQEASAWVGATVEAENEAEVLGVQRDLWDESGYDSDGHWHESDLSAQTDFVPAQAGTYFVRLYAEPEGARAPSGQAYFRLHDGATYPWYLFWYSFLAFVVGAICLVKSSPRIQEAFKEGFSSD